MLTRRRQVARVLTAALCTVGACVGVVAAAQAPSSADDVVCGPGETKVFVPPSSYTCTSSGATQPAPSPTGGGGTGVVTPPTCDLKAIDGSDYDNPTAPYCADNKVCLTVDLFAPLAMPDGEKPNEDSKARVEICRNPLGPIEVGTAFWSDDEEPPSLLQQAQTAIGQIVLPAPTVNVSPTGRTLVNLDTWFWATGTPRESSGSSAFGLVAIATLSRLDVDPGDGSGGFACAPVPTTAEAAEQTCTHTYRRASTRGSQSVDGRAAYAVSARATYTLRFEVDGTPTPVVGAPDTLTGPLGTTSVVVTEAQTVVRPNR